VKQLWTALIVTGLVVVAGSGAFAQRYSPPSGGGSSTPAPKPEQHNPDPFGLTLAASGAAAAVGYVMRRKRGVS
jgi:hypothetical protein